jgi:hypothetical protein
VREKQSRVWKPWDSPSRREGEKTDLSSWAGHENSVVPKIYPEIFSVSILLRSANRLRRELRQFRTVASFFTPFPSINNQPQILESVPRGFNFFTIPPVKRSTFCPTCFLPNRTRDLWLCCNQPNCGQETPQPDKMGKMALHAPEKVQHRVF